MRHTNDVFFPAFFFLSVEISLYSAGNLPLCSDGDFPLADFLHIAGNDVERLVHILPHFFR